ncbi:hypothetical protein M1116_01650 [Patescibacteria group bacterium]|nr:hypothetical protein [Patescibacteria group bacterium]
MPKISLAQNCADGFGSDWFCRGKPENTTGCNIVDTTLSCQKYAGSNACYCGKSGDPGVVKSWCVNGSPAANPDSSNPQVYTAIGCVPASFDKMIEWLLPYFFGITGGISFLIMVYGFILMATAGGDPKAVAGAQDTITSAIKGLFLSAFAIFIVRLIILDILHIPGIN